MIDIKYFFDKDTATYTYIVTDPISSCTAIIDSVLNYNPEAGHISTHSADEIIAYIKENNLSLEWILETHIHADHLTASHYIKDKIGGKTGIGSGIKDVLDYWVPVFNMASDTPTDGSQFDHLLKDNEVIKLGNIDIKVLHTPGHTPACVCYLIEDVIFVGDTLFMPDVGTARTDFPGGDAGEQYHSLKRILSLPQDTRIFTGHDYPSSSREASCCSTVLEQKTKNILIRDGVSEQEYISIRNGRDQGKAVPKLLLPSIQINLRGGKLPKAEENGISYIKIPLNQF